MPAAFYRKKMAFTGKRISNPVNGQAIQFLTTAKDSKGVVLEMVSTWQPASKPPSRHFHPIQDERFRVLEGELTVELNGKKQTLREGDSVHIPANTVHGMWNESAKPTVVHWSVFPALQTEYFLETSMGLAADGKVGKKGMPDILQVALLARKYRQEFRLPQPAFLLQQCLFLLLTPFALLSGKKAVYPHYLD